LWRSSQGKGLEAHVREALIGRRQRCPKAVFAIVATPNLCISLRQAAESRVIVQWPQRCDTAGKKIYFHSICGMKMAYL
jgi:hypothetical protein